MRAPLLPAALALLAGCSNLQLEYGEPLDLERCMVFEPGRTRRAEVLEALGPPTALAAHARGVAFLYEHVSLDERQLGISLDVVGTLLSSPWLGMFKLSLGRSGSRRDTALLCFDAEGVLTAVGTGSWEEVFGKGGSVQVLVAVEQVVDSGSLRATPRGLSWGRELLEPTSAGLNRVHRADLELRGTPPWAGQRSLEQLGGGAQGR